MNKFYFLILVLFFYGEQKAQFTPVLTEGDFVPIIQKLNVEEQNVKFKDVPSVYCDVKRDFWHTTWTQFDVYKSKRKQDLSVIYYARSQEEGKTWSVPKQLNTIPGDCKDADSTVKGPDLCVGLNGELYVSWASPKGLAFQCSLDSGKTWLKEEKIINPIKGGWSCKVGEVKTNGLPVIACDLSLGEYKGRVYICWSDEKNGEKNKDVFLIYSDDKGLNWTEPILVTYRPNHKEQFNPCLKVDSLSGQVYILYFDKQNYYEGNETDVYLALSKNGGLKFDAYKINTHSFAFNTNHLELVQNNGIRPQWVQVMDSKRFGLYEVILNDSTINDYLLKDAGEEIQMERSFKFGDKIKMDYTVKHNTFVTAVITKPLEPGFEKLIVKNKRAYAGANSLEIDTKLNKLKKGNYTVTLYYNNRNSFAWITEE